MQLQSLSLLFSYHSFWCYLVCVVAPEVRAAAAGASSAGAASAPAIAITSGLYDEEPTGSGDPSRAQSCSPVPIQVPMCTGIRYNTTASYVKQKEMENFLRKLDELVRLQCAPYLRLFVCSMRLPFCNRDQNLLVRPCQEFCSAVRNLCVPEMRKFGYDWPEGLACESLPLEAVGAGSNRKNLCLRPNADEFNTEASRLQEQKGGSGGQDRQLSEAAAAAAAAAASAAGTPRYQETLPGNLGGAEDSGGAAAAAAGRWPNASAAAGDERTTGGRRRRCSAAELAVGGSGPDGGWCARRCRAHLLFAREDKEFAEACMLAWSVVCLAVTAAALATFALDARRFRYPERPVVWVAACHLFHSAAHLLRAALGPQLACSRPSGSDLALVSRHAGEWCAAVFLLLYFSWLAGLLWWLALALCWHLSTVRRWGHQLLAERAVWLHLLAWGAPLMLSVVLLVLHRIEGDELTHLCVVDGSRPANLLMFHVAPAATALLLGLGFLASAMRAVFGGAAAAAATEACNDGNNKVTTTTTTAVILDGGGGVSGSGTRGAAEQQAAKISLFSFLFVLPIACVLAANLYELLERHKWTASLEAVLSRAGCVGVEGVNRQDPACGLASRPSAVLYMLKVFASLTAGLPAGLLIWANGQSAAAWRRCFCRWRVLESRRRRAESAKPNSAAAGAFHQHQHLPQHPLHHLPHQHQHQQNQHQHQHQQNQQHQYQIYQQRSPSAPSSYATVDSVRCETSLQRVKPQHQHQLVAIMQTTQHQRQHLLHQVCVSDV